MEKKFGLVVTVAEDDPDDRLLLKDAFDTCRPEVKIIFFDDGLELLEYLTGKLVRPEGRGSHLIVLSLHLPKKTGFEVIAEIKVNPALRPIPLVVLTDTPSENDIERCYQLGANTVISKPQKFDELIQIVKKMCDYWFSAARV